MNPCPWWMRLACWAGLHRWVFLPGFWPSCWACDAPRMRPW